MGFERDGRTRRYDGLAGVVALLALVAAACTSAQATTSPSPRPAQPPVAIVSLPEDLPTATPTLPVCSDGPNALRSPYCRVPTPPPMPAGIVTPRPSRDEPSPTPLQSGNAATPWPTDAPDGLRMDGASYFSATLAAGTSTSIAVDFEGTSDGSLMVFASSADVKASFRGVAIKGESGLAPASFSYTAKPPENGTLVITNTGRTEATIGGSAYILTRRHLIVTASTILAVKGQPLAVTATLTGATDADDAVAYLVTKTTKTGVDITRTSTGHWTTTVTPPESGEYEVDMLTTGPRNRAGEAIFTASDGDVSAGSALREQPIDENRDGLIDELDLTTTITVGTAGRYRVQGTLIAADGTAIYAGDSQEVVVAAGAPTPVTLKLDGAAIYKSRRWGPYELRLRIDREGDQDIPEAMDLSAGHTSAYDYMQFQHDRLSVDSTSITGKAIDLDGDGIFEAFRVSGTVTVENAGRYALQVDLEVSNPWATVGGAYVYLDLVAGTQTVSADIKGSDIAKSGRDGPYKIAGFTLSVFNSADPNAYALGWPTFASPPYKSSQFH